MDEIVKINFVYYDLDEELATESVWAEKENNYYRIKNIPFFAPNISYDDLISVEEDEEELFFEDIIETSGNSTLQIIIYNKNDIADITKMIEHFGCDWEGSHLEGPPRPRLSRTLVLDCIVYLLIIRKTKVSVCNAVNLIKSSNQILILFIILSINNIIFERKRCRRTTK